MCPWNLFYYILSLTTVRLVLTNTVAGGDHSPKSDYDILSCDTILLHTRCCPRGGHIALYLSTTTTVHTKTICRRQPESSLAHQQRLVSNRTGLLRRVIPLHESQPLLHPSRFHHEPSLSILRKNKTFPQQKPEVQHSSSSTMST